ncbi:MAG: TIGR02300 family protein [Rhodospirillales bacterium]|nr:MAG: TIGR02300 family protein [Rhodospirillales bacterium]
MAKPEWGTKRTCHNCGARFYDLQRDPIVCPVCSTVYDPGRQAKTRRAGVRGAVAPVAAVVPEEAAEETEEEAVVEDEAVASAGDGENAGSDDLEEIESEDSDLMEDTSDLGEDDDDIGEVIEHIEDDVDDKP